ncbi:hypothetical protein EON65_16880, partial [archaeon]
QNELVRYQPQSNRDALRRLRVIVISDTHEAHNVLGTLPPCDILIHAGDIMLCSRRHTSWHNEKYVKSFGQWFASQPAACRIIVPGNHDMPIEHMTVEQRAEVFPDTKLLLNEAIELFGLTIWGCPYSHGRSGNKAWQATEFHHQTIQQAHHMAGKVDVLITHGPCKDIVSIVQPRLMYIFGHIHEHHGCQLVQIPKYPESEHTTTTIVQTAGPIMTRKYIPNHHPVVVDMVFGGQDRGEDGEEFTRQMSIRRANTEEIGMQPVHTKSHLTLYNLCTIC